MKSKEYLELGDGTLVEVAPGELAKTGKTETTRSAYVMQYRASSLFAEMIQGKISGYRVEMDRGVHPAVFHITTWR